MLSRRQKALNNTILTFCVEQEGLYTYGSRFSSLQWGTGSGSAFKWKGWIRIRTKVMQIRNPDLKWTMFLNNTILTLYVEQEAGKEGEPTTFLVRVKTQEEADSLKESLDKLASTASSWLPHTHSTADCVKTIAEQIQQSPDSSRSFSVWR